MAPLTQHRKRSHVVEEEILKEYERVDSWRIVRQRKKEDDHEDTKMHGHGIWLARLQEPRISGLFIGKVLHANRIVLYCKDKKSMLQPGMFTDKEVKHSGQWWWMWSVLGEGYSQPISTSPSLFHSSISWFITCTRYCGTVNQLSKVSFMNSIL